MSSFSRFTFTYLALVSPPIALAIDVFAPSLPEIGRADDEDLEALRPSLVASPRTGRDAHRVPFLELDDLVVELHPPAPAQDHVHLLLRLVRVAVRKAIAGRDALVAQARFLERERLGRRAELQVRRAFEPGSDVLQILLNVPERERHVAILWRHSGMTPERNDRLGRQFAGGGKMGECRRRPRSRRCSWPSCSSRASAGRSASMSSTIPPPACWSTPA